MCACNPGRRFALPRARLLKPFGLRSKAYLRAIRDRHLFSPVDFAAMGDDPNIDSLTCVVNEIDHALVTNADAPKAGGAGKFHGAWGAWIGGQGDGLCEEARLHRLGQSVQGLVGAGFETDLVGHGQRPKRLRTACKGTDGSRSRRLASAMSPLS